MAQDLFLVLFLAFLETILSVDNALVLALLARGLPQEKQRKALTYGLAGAVVFRLVALLLFTALMHWTWIKLLGGAYLVFISTRHFLRSPERRHSEPANGGFWKTVAVIELTDIAFAVDSILAAIALTPRIWIVFAGGLIGVVIVRFAACFFIDLLRRFPGLETTAYRLVLAIGFKVLLEATGHPALRFSTASSPAFWVFWATMLFLVLLGFRPKRRK